MHSRWKTRGQSSHSMSSPPQPHWKQISSFLSFLLVLLGLYATKVPSRLSASVMPVTSITTLTLQMSRWVHARDHLEALFRIDWVANNRFSSGVAAHIVEASSLSSLWNVMMSRITPLDKHHSNYSEDAGAAPAPALHQGHAPQQNHTFLGSKVEHPPIAAFIIRRPNSKNRWWKPCAILLFGSVVLLCQC